MKLKQLLRQVRREFRRDAEIILAHLLRVKVADLHLLGKVSSATVLYPLSGICLRKGKWVSRQLT
ncbi:MAG: hypothetical protein Q9N34_04465 [Aquificota bacterium]|nr:hypothetical protein [Aquificota bacterium]